MPETAAGVTRRILRDDRARGVEIAINTYKPGTASAPEPVAHDGCEFGVVLDGTLEVTVGGRTHKLQKGDLISYPIDRAAPVHQHQLVASTHNVAELETRSDAVARAKRSMPKRSCL